MESSLIIHLFALMHFMVILSHRDSSKIIEDTSLAVTQSLLVCTFFRHYALNAGKTYLTTSLPADISLFPTVFFTFSMQRKVGPMFNLPQVKSSRAYLLYVRFFCKS